MTNRQKSTSKGKPREGLLILRDGPSAFQSLQAWKAEQARAKSRKRAKPADRRKPKKPRS